jgi:hypothetical protein
MMEPNDIHNPHNACMYRAGCKQTQASRAALLAEIAALRKDAERYRWLRDNACTAQANTIGPIYRIDVQILGQWTLAAAVDAAMATRPAVGAA